MAKVKTKYKLVQDKPFLIIYLTKNGKPTSEAVARKYLAENWPHITKWTFYAGDHSLVAKQVIEVL